MVLKNRVECLWIRTKANKVGPAWPGTEGGCSEIGDSLFSHVDRMRWNGHILHQGRCQFDFRKHFFFPRVAKHGNSLLRKMIESWSLEMFKNVFIWHLGTWLNDEHSGDTELMTLKMFYNLKNSMVLCGTPWFSVNLAVISKLLDSLIL